MAFNNIISPNISESYLTIYSHLMERSQIKKSLTTSINKIKTKSRPVSCQKKQQKNKISLLRWKRCRKNSQKRERARHLQTGLSNVPRRATKTTVWSTAQECFSNLRPRDKNKDIARSAFCCAVDNFKL